MMIVSSDNPWYFCRQDLSKRYLDDGCSMRLEMEGTVYREQGLSRRISLNRRGFLAGVAGTAVLAGLNRAEAFALTADTDSELNLARVALPSSWTKPVAINKIDIYWAIDPPRPNGPPGSGFGRTAAPVCYQMLYWDGSDFVPVANAQGLGVAGDTFNTTSFDVVKTDKLRLEVVSDEIHAAGIIEWKVYNCGPAPSLPPVVDAGIDRSVACQVPARLAPWWIGVRPEPPAAGSAV
jgi:hypothetical protein